MGSGDCNSHCSCLGLMGVACPILAEAEAAGSMSSKGDVWLHTRVPGSQYSCIMWRGEIEHEIVLRVTTEFGKVQSERITLRVWCRQRKQTHSMPVITGC